MAVQRYRTAGDIVNRAAKELGLGTEADPFSSANPDFQKLTQMLTSVGLELADFYEWEHLIREHTFTTVTNQTPYDLPEDFLQMIDQTVWNRTMSQPLAGSLSPQVWQYNKSSQAAGIFAEFRLRTNQIYIGPPDGVQGDQTIAFEYKSRSWVRPAAAGLGNGDSLGPSGADSCDVTGDWPLFDPLLLQYGIKLMWKKDGGFDTTTAEADFMRALNAAQGRTTGTAVLPVTPVTGGGGLIGPSNLPYGS